MFPPYTEEEYVEGLRHVFDEFVSLGLTTIHASMTDSTEFRAMQRLRRDGESKLRVCVHASGREDGIESLGVEVVKRDLVPVVLQGAHGHLGNGVVETVLVGVGQDN